MFLPLVPGVDTLLEPLQEQAEDAQRYMDSTNEALTHDVEDTLDSARQRYLAYQKKVWPCTGVVLLERTFQHSKSSS